jgi:hypothetical protein
LGISEILILFESIFTVWYFFNFAIFYVTGESNYPSGS